MSLMNVYSKDLRSKALAAIDHGVPRREVQDLFGLSRSIEEPPPSYAAVTGVGEGDVRGPGAAPRSRSASRAGSARWSLWTSASRCRVSGRGPSFGRGRVRGGR